jgi:hypothetical protein
MSMIELIIWLIVVLLVGAAILGVVRAVLALPPFETVRPYGNVVYALIVLLVILVAVSRFPGGHVFTP